MFMISALALALLAFQLAVPTTAGLHLVQGVVLRKLPQRGNAAQLRHHMGPHVMGDQLVTLEVGAVDPDLSQQPVTAGVRGQKDRVLRTGRLLELKGYRQGQSGSAVAFSTWE